jgi:hypothetical protein
VYYKTILLTKEQDNPVLSGSTFNCSTLPFLINIEYLLERMPPSGGKSIARSNALVSSALGSANKRT